MAKRTAKKYEFIRKVGTGGMATVDLVRVREGLGVSRTLVLKRLLPHRASVPEFRKLFLQEAQLAAQLQHPNLVQFVGFDEDDDGMFLLLEYVDGLSLRDLIAHARSHKRLLPPGLCARIIAGACEGLAYAHELRDASTGRPLYLVHRDVSPENILLSRHGEIKVVDFGVAKVHAGDALTNAESGFKGKYAYMSPEQSRALDLDRRSDVFSLGLVLYELIAGRKPFEVKSDVEIIQAIRFRSFTSLRALRPELPEEIQEIMEWALAKAPAERYADCRAFQVALEAFANGLKTPAESRHLAAFVNVTLRERGHADAGPRDDSMLAPATFADPTQLPETLAKAPTADTRSPPAAPVPPQGRLEHLAAAANGGNKGETALPLAPQGLSDARAPEAPWTEKAFSILGKVTLVGLAVWGLWLLLPRLSEKIHPSASPLEPDAGMGTPVADKAPPVGPKGPTSVKTPVVVTRKPKQPTVVQGASTVASVQSAPSVAALTREENEQEAAAGDAAQRPPEVGPSAADVKNEVTGEEPQEQSPSSIVPDAGPLAELSTTPPSEPKAEAIQEAEATSEGPEWDGGGREGPMDASQ
ncbi:protein kinase [Corallococcus coralloides]|uniref:serine/threonine protein kinase n=1 Tax=Corallococcus coralloides TaxID=184914 RepID=UPI0038502A74